MEMWRHLGTHSYILLLILTSTNAQVRRASKLEKNRDIRLARDAPAFESQSITSSSLKTIQSSKHQDCTTDVSEVKGKIVGYQVVKHLSEKDSSALRDESIRPDSHSDSVHELKETSEASSKARRPYGGRKRRQRDHLALVQAAWINQGMSTDLPPEELAEKAENLQVNGVGRKALCHFCSGIIKKFADKDYHTRYIAAKKKLWEPIRMLESRERYRVQTRQRQALWRKKIRERMDDECIKQYKEMGIDFSWPIEKIYEAARKLPLASLTVRQGQYLIRRYFDRLYQSDKAAGGSGPCD